MLRLRCRVYSSTCPSTSTPPSSRTRGCRTTTACSRSPRPRSPSLARARSVRDDQAVGAASIRCCAGRSRFSRSCATRSGTPTGISLLNKRIGVGTALLYDVAPGARIGCLGPLGRPFEPVAPPAEAWMVAGGVGLAPFVTLAEALRAAERRRALFYGARRGADLTHVELFERAGRRAGARDRRRQPGRARVHHRAARGRAATHRRARATSALRLRPDADDAGRRPARRGARPALRRLARAGDGLRPRRLLQLRRPDANGAAARRISCDPASTGPVFDATRILWDALAH